MKTILIISVLVALVLSQTAHESFISFMRNHNKKYKSDAEFHARFRVYKENMKVIENLNARGNQEGKATFALNKFADLSPAEFKHLYLMNNVPSYNANPRMPSRFLPRDVPAKFDWRTTGLISSIKDQGQCGSCWAFSATENIESVWAQKNNLTTPSILSPQQIVDCDDTCYGCGGGWPYLAFQYVTQAGGQDSESSYPYTARDGTCRYDESNVVAKLNGYDSIPKDEKQIQALTADVEKGAPYSICVDAASWQFYSGGVMTADQCGQSVDHCTQLIGYDTSKTTQNLPYWIVRNSWGTDWGLQGIIYLEMFKNTCIMSNYVTNAKIASK